MARRSYPLGFAFLLAVMAPASAQQTLPPGPAVPGALRLGYAVYLGGMHVLDGTIRMEVDGDSYWVEVATKPDGAVSYLMPWETRAESGGQVASADLRPQRHETLSRWRQKIRTVTLDYDADGDVTAKAEPPPAADDRDPVPPSLLRDTMDPLSGILAAIHDVGEGKGCGRTVAVFDGRRRYDLLFSEGGTREIAKSRYSAYAGPAVICRVAFKPIAGYPKKRENSRFWQGRGSGGRPPADLWLAAVTPGGFPVPVRLETDSVFGSLVVHLTSIERESATAASR